MNELADEDRFSKIVSASLKEVRNGAHGRHSHVAVLAQKIQADV